MQRYTECRSINSYGGLKTPKYSGWIVEKKYFKVEVEADNWLQAKENIWHCDLEDVFDTQWDLYDLEEVEEDGIQVNSCI